MQRLFIITTCIALSVLMLVSASNSVFAQESPQTILIFTKTNGFRHESIPAGVEAFIELADKNNIQAKHTEEVDFFNSDSLSNIDGIVFLSTSGDIFNNKQQQALKQFVRSGGGVMGVHAATTTEYNWPWFGNMLGAYFDQHPRIQEARVHVKDPDHSSTSFLPSAWTRTDEWYNYKQISDDIHVLLELDERTYEGGTNGAHHPIAWCHKYEGGHIFYTGLGHTIESYSEPLFRKHLEGGLRYILEAEE